MTPEFRALWKLAGRIKLARHYAKEKNVLGWLRATMPHMFYLPFCELHEYLVKIRGVEFSCTLAPRGHAKTAVGDIGIPLFQALEEPETFQHYLTIQGSQQKALTLNRTIKGEIESNEVLLALYGDMKGDRWTDEQFELRNRVAFSAVSTGTSVRGLLYRGRRPDYLMPDDLYNEDHINNPEATTKVNDWFWSTLFNARAQTKRWAIHLTGTAINEYDLMQKIQKQAKEDEAKGVAEANRTICRVFKASPSIDQKKVLWPELWSVGGREPFDALMTAFGRMGSHIAMREMQNEPRDEATAIVKRSWLYKSDGSSWEYDPIDLRRRIKEEDAGFKVVGVRIGNDPSIGKTKSSDGGKKKDGDPTGTAKVIETMQGEGSEYWIEWVDAKQMSMRERKQQLKEIAKDCSPDAPLTEVRIEAIGGFDDYAQYVIDETNLPVKRVEWVPDKITNLENRSHFFENGKVHLSKLIPEEIKDKLVHQLTTNCPDHDDMRDAVLLTMDLDSGTWEKFMR